MAEFGEGAKKPYIKKTGVVIPGGGYVQPENLIRDPKATLRGKKAEVAAKHHDPMSPNPKSIDRELAEMLNKEQK